MNQHPKIEQLTSQRDMLAGSVRGLEEQIERAREDVDRAQIAVDELTESGRPARDTSVIHATAERDRKADRLALLRERRQATDADRARLAGVVERLTRWWRQNGGTETAEVFR